MLEDVIGNRGFLSTSFKYLKTHSLKAESLCSRILFLILLLLKKQ